ncbi:MAG: glycosyltransferase [Candidatus Sumerlaeia bacterium]|nr:glycosyltransferase [Candidatus Sumerlaeia bacterium]
MTAPPVSVVVPFHNRVADVPRCLEAVLREARAIPGAEVVVVDNGSTDGTREALAAVESARLVDCARRGPAAARNAGIRGARGELVAFTDSDCVPDPGWLAALVAPFADPDVRAVGGRIDTLRTESGVAWYVATRRLLDNEVFFGARDPFPPFFATANAAYRRADLERVGGFDEELWTPEDADLCWRVMEGGGRMVYVPEAVVKHRHRDTFRGFFRQARDYGRGGYQLYAKHRAKVPGGFPPDWQAIRWLAALPFAGPWIALAAPNGPERRTPLYDAVWLTGILLGRLEGWRKTRRRA